MTDSTQEGTAARRCRLLNAGRRSQQADAQVLLDHFGFVVIRTPLPAQPGDILDDCHVCPDDRPMYAADALGKLVVTGPASYDDLCAQREFLGIGSPGPNWPALWNNLYKAIAE